MTRRVQAQYRVVMYPLEICCALLMAAVMVHPGRRPCPPTLLDPFGLVPGFGKLGRKDQVRSSFVYRTYVGNQHGLVEPSLSAKNGPSSQRVYFCLNCHQSAQDAHLSVANTERRIIILVQGPN